MFSMLKNRFGVPGVISVIALVFAMTGGAFAAKYLITSTKQIKPSVLTALKGKGGPAGAPGAMGPAGPVGPKGDAGAAGAKGETGATGAKGATGETGAKGATGETGATGPAGTTLPSGKTETGLWSIGSVKGIFGEYVTASFPLRLTFNPTFNFRHQLEAPNAACPGTFNNPAAGPGQLCLYATSSAGGGQNLNDASEYGTATVDPKSGFTVEFTLKKETEEAYGTGSWAVTAP